MVFPEATSTTSAVEPVVPWSMASRCLGMTGASARRGSRVKGPGRGAARHASSPRAGSREEARKEEQRGGAAGGDREAPRDSELVPPPRLERLGPGEERDDRVDHLAADGVERSTAILHAADAHLELAAVGPREVPAHILGERHRAHRHVAHGLDGDLGEVAVAEHEVLQIRLDDCDRVEVGVAQRSAPVEEQDRPLEEDPVLGNVERPRELAEADVHALEVEEVLEPALRIDLDVFEVQAVEADLFLKAPVEVLDDALAHALVDRARDEAHLPERLHQAIGVAAEDALEELRDALAHLRTELGDGSEVEQDDRAVRLDQEVPGVRIRVVDAVDEDHLAVEAHDPPGHVFLVDAERVEPRDVADLHALDERRGQDALGADLTHRAREDDGRISGEVRGDALDVVGLEREVELLRQELLDLMVVRVEALNGHEELDDLHDAADGLQIQPHDAVDVAVLHFHADALPVDELRHVHLPERGARDRLAIERRESAHAIAELALEAIGDLGIGPRRYLILERFELGPKLRREEVRHDREQLPDLDEEALQPEDRRVDTLRVAPVRLPEVGLAPRAAEDARTQREPQVARDDGERRRVGLDEAKTAGRDGAMAGPLRRRVR